MKSLKPLSLAGSALMLMATTLPIGCAGTSTPTTTPSAGVSSTLTNADVAAVTGVVYTAVGTDGRLVPPETPQTIQVLDNGKEVASVQTDPLGRFYISNIPAPSQGKDYTIKVGGIFEQVKTLFPGRVLNLSSLKTASRDSQPQQLTRVTGILRNSEDQPLANVTVRDKNSTFRKTVTDATGRFSLEVIGSEIEVLNGLVPITIAIDEFQKNSTVKVNTTNIRSISGKIIDKTNSNIFLKDIKVKVQGSSVSARSDKDGNFTLSGAPVEPFILEVESPKGYAPFNVEIPPATFDNSQKPQNVTQDLALSPVGSVQVNFIAESAPGFDRLPCELNLNPPAPAPNGSFVSFVNPQSYINCFAFTMTGPNGSDIPEYDNTYFVDVPLRATITVEGTGITQTVTYPITPFRILYGSDPTTGDTVKISDRAHAANVVFSVQLDNVPGGRQSITISMDGHQTQKSLPVYIPPNDTISTELITLYRVQPISSFGDVKGVIKGSQPLPAGKELRIVYLDLKDSFNYIPTVGDKTNPDLLAAIQSALASGPKTTATEVKDAQGNFLRHEFYLKNVPTGSRIMLAAAVVNSDDTLSDCYIPNTSVLLNVRASQINLAPDLELTRRLTESDCTATP